MRISEQTITGETSYVLKNPQTVTYNRYGATEYELLTLCDGTRTAGEIAEAMSERHPENPLSESDVLDFLDSIEPELWEQTLGQKNLAILEKIKEERKSRIDQSKILYITFKAVDPNKLLDKLDRAVGWLIYSRAFVIFSAILFALTVIILAGDWTRVQRDTAALWSFQNKSAYDLWVFWVLLWTLGCIHEMGHGLTCKHFGGDVHQMGFMLIYFTPAFYTDTTDMLLFQKTSHRQWTIFGGIWIELVICGVATIIWSLAQTGSTISDLAYKTLLFSGIQGALVNLNPLIKADGYYALAQYLRMDNLREDTFAFLEAWANKTLLRKDVEIPPTSRRQRRIFFIFGILALCYSTFVIVFVLLFVKNILISKFGVWWGYLGSAGMVYWFMRKKIRKALPVIRARWKQAKERYMAWKMTRPQMAGIAVAALLLTIPPMTGKITSDFILEPGRYADIRASAPGRVAEVLVHSGDRVQANQIVAVLRNPELEARAEVLEIRVKLAQDSLGEAVSHGDASEEAAASEQVRRFAEELSVTRAKLNALDLRAPFAGIVTSPDVEQRVGENLAEGDAFATVVNRDRMRARIFVHDWDLHDILPHASARLKVLALPWRTFTGDVAEILPAASTDSPVSQTEVQERYGQPVSNYFAVILEFPNPQGELREGMTGTAKISGHRYPLAWRAARNIYEWLRAQVW
ncbi:MAG: efflux RND transporter periplasmic adaptor subunit [Candidatus Acidiferrales bacterium]